MSDWKIALIYFTGVLATYVLVRITSAMSKRLWTRGDRVVALMFASASWAIVPFYLAYALIVAIREDFFTSGSMDERVGW